MSHHGRAALVFLAGAALVVTGVSLSPRRGPAPTAVLPAGSSTPPLLPAGELVVAPWQAAAVQAWGASPNGVRDPSLPPDDAAQGLVWGGLERAEPGEPCAGSVQAATPGLGVICTHGPDAAPPGVDVRVPRTPEDVAAATSGGAVAAATATVPCYGDGVSGKRVQVIYARAADKADRYASFASQFPAWAGYSEAVFSDSAAETGGVRHVRWVTDADCNLSVVRVQLSAAGDDNFSNTHAELMNLGFNRSDRKYLVWVDANVYCGIAQVTSDDRAGATNSANNGPHVARVDNGCWGSSNSVEAHEIMHNLGGVQLSAPHTSGGWHCTDEYDRMCYSDAAGVTMTYPCASHERLFDCNHDDYYHTDPAPGSYLSTHWNAAMSAFLETTDPGGTTTTTVTPTTTTLPPPTTTLPPTTTTTLPTTTTTLPPPTTTTVPPTRMTAVTYGGVWNWWSRSKTYSLTTGSGPLTATLIANGSATITAAVYGPSGVLLGQRSGTGNVTVTVPVSAGINRVTASASGSKSISYTLRVTYPAP